MATDKKSLTVDDGGPVLTEKQRHRSRRKVRTSIENGKLIKSKHCQRCGTRERKCSDGRSSLHAHHEDYHNPLMVLWVCPKCHARITPHPTGEQHPFAKLTYVQVEVIRVLHRDGWTNGRIACVFGVYHPTIARIVNGHQWIAEKRRTEKTDDV